MALTIKQVAVIQPGAWASDGWPRGAGQLMFHRTRHGEIHAYFRHVKSDGGRDSLPVGRFDPEGKQGRTLKQLRERAGEWSQLYRAGIRDLRDHFAAQEAERQAELQARKEAEESARLAAERASRYTLQALCDEYVALLDSRGKQSSAGDAKSAFKVHLTKAAPDLAATPAAAVTPEQIADVIREVQEAGKTRTAGIVRSYLNAAFATAARAPFDSSVPLAFKAFGIKQNPVTPIPAVPINAGQRVLTDTELRSYLVALDENDIRDAALLIALLGGGQRVTQLLRTRVDDYNVETGALRLWDSKGRRRKAREHLIPLGPRGRAIVELVIAKAHARHKKARERGFEIGTNPTIWPSETRYNATMTPDSVRKRATEIATQISTGGFSLRDVRRTVETRLAGMGISSDVRAVLLSHGLGGVQHVHYDRHDYVDEKRRVLEAWEEHLEHLANGKEASNVRSLRA